MSDKELGVEYTCQKCLRRKKTTWRRTLKSKDYIGPCGDSFCYASCTMSTCVPVVATVCEECAKKIEGKK